LTLQEELNEPRNPAADSVDPDADRRHSSLAAQQELGYMPSTTLDLVVPVILILVLMVRL
jgi:hypothetical protein